MMSEFYLAYRASISAALFAFVTPAWWVERTLLPAKLLQVTNFWSRLHAINVNAADK